MLYFVDDNLDDRFSMHITPCTSTDPISTTIEAFCYSSLRPEWNSERTRSSPQLRRFYCYSEGGVEMSPSVHDNRESGHWLFKLSYTEKSSNPSNSSILSILSNLSI